MAKPKKKTAKKSPGRRAEEHALDMKIRSGLLPKKKTAKKSPAHRKSVTVRRRKSDLDDLAEAMRARAEEHALDMKIRSAFLELIVVTTDAVKAWRENSTAVAACIIQEMQSDDDDGSSDAADDDDHDADDEDPYEGPVYGGLEDD